MSRWQTWWQWADLASQKQADSYSGEGGMCLWCRQHLEVISPWLQFEWLVRSKPFTYTLSCQTHTHLYFPFSHHSVSLPVMCANYWAVYIIMNHGARWGKRCLRRSLICGIHTCPKIERQRNLAGGIPAFFTLHRLGLFLIILSANGPKGSRLSWKTL